MTTAKESVALVRSEVRRRSQILGTQVISQGNANRLGLVNQIWVDPDAKEVVFLGVREQAFSGIVSYLNLNRIAALGPDAILVASDDVFEDIDLEGLVGLIGSDVVTETGTRLGKVKDFEFNASNGAILDLILSNLGIPLLPGFLVSTYSLSVEELLSAGPNRLIVTDGSEARLTKLTTSFLEQFGIGKPPWEQLTSTPSLPSSAQSLRDVDEDEDEYDQDYEEEYDEEEDEIYEEEEATPRAPMNAAPPDYQQEYTATEEAAPEKQEG